eukprot:TRINITY_DN4066_c0_g1_i2.p2 TRINITY_DN4066_c0_g1~~TRINITY_DN4066_c0_g1_i2.p2  ORF type:complete len:144 (-),score=19.94 TRINITY_DN4066_c0_g1_i2:106-537(-)
MAASAIRVYSKLAPAVPLTALSHSLSHRISISSGIRVFPSAVSSSVRYRLFSASQETMDTNKKQSATFEKEKDDMAEAFGEGYATRSSEEGFGGIYRSGPDIDLDAKPEYEKTQGSKVSEKEDDRHAPKDPFSPSLQGKEKPA